MILKSVSAIAVCGMLCAQHVKAETKPAIFSTDSIQLFSGGKEIRKKIQEISEDLDLVNLDINQSAELPRFVPESVKNRLLFLEKDVPLDYNEQVQTYIDMYSSSRYKNHLSRMLGLGAYYFPIYERIFESTGLPKEIKYLSVVESALNPDAVSRMGATGPWQFMYATAKMYDLSMDSYIDERKDPIAASYAASAYLKDAFNEFGDWLLAIASYNCGKGNVTRAINRSGKQNPNFWDISPFLPKETRNYVPAFIALTYMLELHEEHGVVPSHEEALSLQTEMVSVQQHVPFASIAKAINVEEELIKRLNPAYKRNVVNGSVAAPRRLVLPAVSTEFYAPLYAALNTPAAERVQFAFASDGPAKEAVVHRVKQGESLGKIAQQYRVTVQDLRAWNNLKGNTILPGQQLRVENVVAPRAANPSKSSAKQISYQVKRGDTLSGIASKYKGVTVSKLKADNNLKNNQIKAGMVLKISQI